MVPLKLCLRFGGSLQVTCSAHAGFLNRAVLPQCGASFIRCNQVDAARSDLSEPARNKKKSTDDKKEENREKKSENGQPHSSSSVKTSTSGSGDGGDALKNQVKSHIYSSIYPWTSKDELVDVLMKSQIFHNDDLLVLNKPYGLAQVNIGSRFSYGLAPPPFTLTEVLPILAERVQARELKVAIAPEKWQSGVLVLTKNKKSANRIKLNKSMSPSAQVCTRQFWAVTRNRAYPSEKPFRVAAIHGETVPSGAKVPVLELAPSINKVRQQLVNRFYVTHSTLDESETTGAALMQVGVTRTMHHSVRVWLAHHLAPPLGDHLFGSRVAYLLGTPVPVPHSRASSQPPYSFELLKKIELLPSIQDLLPLMMHLRTVTLPRYYWGKRSKLKTHDRKYFANFSQDLNTSSETGDRVAEVGETADGQDSNAALNPGSNLVQTSVIDGLFSDEVGCEKDMKKKTLALEDTSPSLVLTAAVPQHFAWTMEKLGINGPST